METKTNFSKANKGGRFDGRKEDEGLQLYVKGTNSLVIF